MIPKLFQGQPYVPNSAESWGQSVCSSIKFLLELGLYTSPLWDAIQ